jgi:hypothetical protein
MTYIGNARSLLIVGPNTRDDLISTVENQVTFELSQEVPGGYESNVTVLRQKYIIDNLITNNNSITVDQAEVGRRTTPSTERLLQSSDSAVRAALSVVKVGDIVKLSIPSSPSNSLNDVVGFPVKEVVYTGDTIKIYLQTSATGTVNTSANDTAVSITLGSLDNWEVLEPERQYTIGSANGKTNKYITLTESPNVNDKVYVLHKGEATYNFVPTAKSVGPDQLTENLRNFRTDRYTATGDTTEAGRTFAITATEDPEYTVVDARSLLVTVDGETLDCDGKDSLGQNFQGAWKLNSDRDAQNRQTITFHVAPAAGKKIRILNLGFSTVSRRASFSLGQATTPGQGSVGEDELKNDSVSEGKIRDGAVTTPKIRNNAVNGTKILLENDELLRSKTNTSVRPTPTEFGLLKLGTTNITELFGDPELSISIAGTKKVSVNATEIYPETTDDVSLGTLTKRFKNLELSGNITVSGTVDGVDVSTLKSTVDQIKDIINTGAITPIGTIIIWTSNNIPNGYLRCNGAALNTYTHRELHKIISNTFNAAGVAYQAGVTDIPSATSVFYLPDLITRFPVGARISTDFTGSTNNLGTTESPQISVANRIVSHTHTGAPHTHTFEHKHNVPGHYHTNQNVSGALNITSSGGHTTRMDHEHSDPTGVPNETGTGTTSPIRNNITWSTTAGRGTHQHGSKDGVTGRVGTELCDSLNHQHRSWVRNSAGNTTNQDQWLTDYVVSVDANGISHSHTIAARGTSDDGDERSSTINYKDHGGNNRSITVVTGVDPHNHDVDDSGTGGSSVATGPDGGTEGPATTRSTSTADTDHRHDISKFYTDVCYTVASNPASHADGVRSATTLSHTHDVFIPSANSGHDHTGGLTISYKNVDINPNSYLPIGNPDRDVDIRGRHTHDRTSISGSLGNVAGSNGNDAFETTGVNLVSGQVPTTSGANFGTNTTGPSVSPHLVVHFIIRATNPQVT